MVYESPSRLNINNGMFDASIAAHTWQDGVGVISFNKDLTKIKYRAFYNNSTLSSIIIPSSVEYIEDYAFSGCNKLMIVDCKATTPPIASSNILSNVSDDLVIYVPKSSVNLYKNASGWTSCKDNIVGK